jgi:5-methylthioribose kinase
MESTELVRTYIDSRKDLPFNSKFTSAMRLSGGLVNYVYRLRFEDNSTAILKYYPRFIASNKSVEVSQSRYFVEKAALKHLATNEYLLNETAVRIPKLLYADDESHMLIMEDAGENNKTLFELLKNESTESDELIPFVAEQIKKLSTFLSDKSNIKAKTHLDEFRNKSIWESFKNYFSHLFKFQAQSFDLESEMEAFLSKVDALIQEPNYESEDTVFVFGDLWPNSFLIDTENKHIWIIDWEMARFNTRFYDIQQLMCNLWIMIQNSSLFNKKRIENLIERLQLEFFGKESLDWRDSCGSNAKTIFILWVFMLIKEEHWQIDNVKETVLKALKEIE